MDTQFKGIFALSIVTVLLAGCGGGGGGGVNIRSTVPFTGAITANKIYTASTTTVR